MQHAEEAEPVQFTKRYSCYETFVRSIRTEISKRKYTDALTKFLKFCNLSEYEQLLQIPDEQKTEAIKEFIMWMETEQKYAPSTINNHFYPVKLFYESNNVLLNWKQLEKTKPKRVITVDDRLYTEEEIKKLVAHSNLREKVVVLCLLSTGMRIGGLASIRLKDMKFIEEYKLYKFTVYPEDIPDRYTTFCTPECAFVINLYLDYRKSYGEPLHSSSPLIAEAADPNTYIATKNPQDNAIKPQSISHIVERLRWRTKIVERERLTKEKNATGRIHKEMMACHAFRKIFNTRCIEHNVNPTVKETLLGHKTNLGLDIHYFRPTEQQLLNEYFKVIDALTVNEENRLKRENKKLKTELQVTDRQIQGMKDNLLLIAKKVGLDVDELTSKFYDSSP